MKAIAHRPPQYPVGTQKSREGSKGLLSLSKPSNKKMADDNAEAGDLNLPNLPVEVVVQAKEPPHAGMELAEGEESTVEDPRQDSDDEFSAVVDGSDRDDDDLSQRSNLPTRTTFNRAEKVENISPTYCAAKELKLSVALMKHINDDAALQMALVEKGCNIKLLEVLCKQDHVFAEAVHDDVAVLREIVSKLKGANAREAFPEVIPTITGKVDEKAIDVENIRTQMAEVTAHHYTQTVLNLVSVAYENRLLFIERKLWLLDDLVTDLKNKGNGLLGVHSMDLMHQLNSLKEDAERFGNQLPKFSPTVGLFSWQCFLFGRMMTYMTKVIDEDFLGALVAMPVEQASSGVANVREAAAGGLSQESLGVATASLAAPGGEPLFQRVTESPGTAMRAIAELATMAPSPQVTGGVTSATAEPQRGQGTNSGEEVEKETGDD
jgi:hypothetical protein